MRTTGRQPADGANPEVNHPEHYNLHPSGVECIEVVRHMGFNLGNVVKYLWRDGLKDTEVPLQDLQKAAWYLQDEINQRNDQYADNLAKQLQDVHYPYVHCLREEQDICTHKTCQEAANDLSTASDSRA